MSRDRYVTFENIDCYHNAVEVLDAMHELFTKNTKAKNEFWEIFLDNIDPDYHEVYAKNGRKDILYHVCSNVFYISDLFEEYNFEKGIKLLEIAEMECC
ncbi:MAG: N(2)-fixation sustaining protein CowN [Sulfurovaceae bacterium]|jgi:N(2)-fixation sustaining protein CowN|nr:N(2)-fixation sustaining protein CowN [Sulfurovaceae bacterium]MDD5549327.1 N(2)-fixation sustaining protein CowN [Sulfurovaceae bacterium]